MNRRNAFDKSGSSPPQLSRERTPQRPLGREEGLAGERENAGPKRDCGEPFLYRVNEVATKLGLGRSKVYEMTKNGELPVLKIGSAVRVPSEALAGWVRANTEKRS